MEIYKLKVTMTYVATVEIEAETVTRAFQQAGDMAGDGALLSDADITDYEVEVIEDVL